MRLTHESELDRRPLFAAVVAALQRATTARPLALLFDDLHNVDADSLRPPRFVVDHVDAAPLLVVAAYRDAVLPADHPLTNLLRAVDGRQEGVRTVLDRLDDSDTRGGTQPRTRARALLADAAHTAHDLGMTVLAHRLSQLRRQQ